MPDPEYRAIPTIDVGNLTRSTPSVLPPSELGRKHLGRKVRFQRITERGQAHIVAVLESVRHDADGYELVLDSGTRVWGNYDDGATVQFLV